MFEIHKRLEKEYEEKFGKEPEPPQIAFSVGELRDMAKRGDWPEAWGGPDELKRHREEEALEKEKEKQMLEEEKEYSKEVG